MYMKKKITPEDIDIMRVQLSVRAVKLSEEPRCDFCGSEQPEWLYAATRMSTGAWVANWRWCACADCSSEIDKHNFDAIRVKIVKWLKSILTNTPEEFARRAAEEALDEFIVFAREAK